MGHAVLSVERRAGDGRATTGTDASRCRSFFPTGVNLSKPNAEIGYWTRSSSPVGVDDEIQVHPAESNHIIRASDLRSISFRILPGMLIGLYQGKWPSLSIDADTHLIFPGVAQPDQLVVR